MNENKPTARRVMIISIVALALFYIAGDWAVYLFGKSRIALAPAFLCAVAAAWTVFFHRFFPKKNSWMIALGVSCFFLCDVNVGLSFLSPFATTLVWMFYTPTLLLLSSSGIDFDKRKIISMRRRYFKAS